MITTIINKTHLIYQPPRSEHKQLFTIEYLNVVLIPTADLLSVSS